MAQSIRIATFNVENLFSRPKLLNFRDNANGDQLLVDLSNLRKELRKTVYDKPQILALFETLKDFIAINETRAHLFNRDKSAVTAGGVKVWDGFISFKQD